MSYQFILVIIVEQNKNNTLLSGTNGSSKVEGLEGLEVRDFSREDISGGCVETISDKGHQAESGRGGKPDRDWENFEEISLRKTFKILASM